jgi:cytochrome d ubiquinol oxidase subunit II
LLSLVLAAFVARGIAIESAVQAKSPARRRAANWVFNVTSVLPPLLLGVALGNVMRGLPINAAGTYEGTVVALLNPYAVLIGLLTLVLFALNGALYLEGRSAGPMRQRLQGWIMPLWCAFAVLHLFAAAATAWWSADLYSGITARPLFWVLTVLWLAGLVSVPALVLMKRFTFAAVGSAGTVAAMVGLVAVALFPRLVPSSGSGISMTLENTAAAPSVLRTTLVMGLILLALIMAATAYVYRSTWRNAPATSNPY